MKQRLYIHPVKSTPTSFVVKMGDQGEWKAKTGDEIFTLLLDITYIPMWFEYEGHETIRDYFKRYDPYNEHSILQKVKRQWWRLCS